VRPSCQGSLRNQIGCVSETTSLGSSRPAFYVGLASTNLASAMAQAITKIWRDLWHRFPVPRSGGRDCAEAHLPPDPTAPPLKTFLISTMVVGLAEIGDKTQILSLMLAARFQRPLPIIFGILFATRFAANALDGPVGIRRWLDGMCPRWWYGGDCRWSANARRSARLS
jgi:hypothetical protein